MRRISYLFIFFLVFSSCSKIPKEFRSLFSGKASATLNGENWKADGRVGQNSLGVGFDLQFVVYNKSGVKEEDLIFIKVPYKTGTYFLTITSGQSSEPKTGSGFATFAYDGDVLEDVYDVLEEPTRSQITITSVDESSGWIEGEFFGVYYLARPKHNSNNPDTIRFEDGEFRVKIED